MNLLLSLKKLIKKIEYVDKHAQQMAKENFYTSNPFAFVQAKTYVWIEKVKDFNQCNLLKKNK